MDRLHDILMWMGVRVLIVVLFSPLVIFPFTWAFSITMMVKESI